MKKDQKGHRNEHTKSGVVAENALLRIRVGKQKIPCPVMWNEFNKVVQCHNCGQIWGPATRTPSPAQVDKFSDWCNENASRLELGELARECANKLLREHRVEFASADECSGFDATILEALTKALSLGKAHVPQFNGCPCHYIEPCTPDCSCVKPYSSFGCRRCCSVGSHEQKVEKAKYLAGKAQADKELIHDRSILLKERILKENEIKAQAKEVEEALRDFSLNWDCDTGAGGTHADYCRKCRATALLNQKKGRGV